MRDISMWKKRKIERKYYIIIIFFGILLLFGVLMYFVRDERKSSIPEQIIQDAVLFVQKIVAIPVHFVTDKINESKEKDKIYERYQQLQTKVEQIEVVEAKNQELESQLQEMKALLELKQVLSESIVLNATVITRNIDGWYQTITIDKGKNHGVAEHMAVVTGRGMIGEVIHVNSFSSTIQLLTGVDETHKISVKIEGNDDYIYGLLSGYERENQVYKIEGIAENTEIKEGANVITTGLGNGYPSGILIGTVKQVKTDHFDMARTILVKPSVDFDEIRYVTLLKK